MIAAERVNTAKMRIATYYLDKLKQVNYAFISGGENTVFALKSFDAEYNQIENIVTWLSDNARHDNGIAKLFSDMLVLGQSLFAYRLPASQCLTLHELALACVKPFNNSPAILSHQIAVADAHLKLNNIAEAFEVLKQATSLAEETGDMPSLAQCLYNLSFTYSELSQEAEATQTANQAFELYQQINDRQNAGYCLFRLAQIQLRQGEWELANTNLLKAYDIAIQYNNQGHLRNILHKLGELRERQGDIDEALEHKKHALEIALHRGNQDDIVFDLVNLAISYDVQGEFLIAQDYYRQALKITNRMGFKRQKALILGNMGYSAYLQGDYSEAAVHLKETLVMVREAQQQSMVCVVLANLVPVSIGLDDISAAYQAVYEGLDIAYDLGNKQLQTMILVAAVQVWVAQAMHQANPDRQATMARAVQWCGLIYSSPFAEQENRDEIDKLLPQIKAVLSEDQIERKLEQGKKLALDDVIADLLAQNNL